MIENISKIDIYLGLAITGVFSGLGSAVGNYFANQHLIKGTKKLMRRLYRR
jgi:hypothetical protein